MVVVDEMVMVNVSEVMLLVTRTVTVIGQDHVVSWLLLLESVVVVQVVPVLMV